MASLSSLELLDLRRNLLEDLVLTDIQDMPKLKRCDLRDNRFACPVMLLLL
jgi:Leucine-rich repeat (LRR) protein